MRRSRQLEVARNDDQITVSVADNGRGILEDRLNSIFEPFVTTKEQGTGLGRTIAKTIIRTYGGNIWAANAASSGTIFHFTLSLVQPQAAYS